MGLTGILSGLAKPVSDFFIRRQELKAEAHKQELAVQQAIADRKIELIKLGLTADMQWEMQMASQAATSWKDEYTLIVISIPAILAFVRTSFLNGPQIVADGFNALGSTPAWYQLVLITLFLATVGIRYWRRNQSDS